MGVHGGDHVLGRRLERPRQPGFRDHLSKTQDRIDAIESLGRTRELVAKDLVLGGTYEIGREPGAGGGKVVVTLRQPPEDDDVDSDTTAQGKA